MKAVYFNEFGGAEKLIYGDLPDPQVRRCQVLIRVAASSVNPVDWKVREGRLKFLSGKRFPIIPGTEVSGVVEALGTDVKGLTVGDRVLAGLSHKGGACAELVAVDQSKVFPIPPELSFAQAATLVIAGMTPLQAFTLHYKVNAGDHVLINGASGGVGMFAVQIAKLKGARVTAVCSLSNFEMVKELGADELIDYNLEDFRMRTNTFDVVLDTAANAFFPEAKKCLRKGGMLIKLNMSVRSVLLGIWTALFSSRKLKMILVKNRASDLSWIIQKVVAGEIRILFDREYVLRDVRSAHEYSETGRVRGKLIIHIPGE